MSLPVRPALVVSWLFQFAVLAGAADQPPAGPPGAVEVRFADNSNLKLTLKDAKVEITTPYGKLAVPTGEILKIDFATRLTDDTTKRIEEAVANLAHSQFAKRDTASAELLKLREKGYPALLEAAKSKDSEVARRAEELIDRIRDAVPAEELEIRKFDVIHTEHSKFSGRIEGTELKATSALLGDVQSLQLTHLRSLRAPGVPADDVRVIHAEADPGTLTSYNDKVGKSFYFKVTGATTATVWGTDVYTTDSQLATAAVHAGALQPGQAGVVKVTIVASPLMFQGSTRNGVTSHPFGQYPAAYKVAKP